LVSLSCFQYSGFQGPSRVFVARVTGRAGNTPLHSSRGLVVSRAAALGGNGERLPVTGVFACTIARLAGGPLHFQELEVRKGPRDGLASRLWQRFTEEASFPGPISSGPSRHSCTLPPQGGAQIVAREGPADWP